ncbi:MAG: Serine protease, subtilase family [Candidatus Acidoferrum typicum]|nr:Serine protease, subtilase family [Candidatus Acidoferrum typicum]
MRRLNVLLIMFSALVLASMVRAQTTPGVNNAELNGNYAFTFNGMTTGGGGASTVFAAVGRFTADGAGNLTNGVLDTNGIGPQEKLVAQAFTGTYQIGADHRGVMALNIPGGGTLAFAMMANGNAKFIEVDAAGGHGTVGSGIMEKADTTAYSTAKIMGDYAFGVAGLDGSNNRTAIAGRLTANGAGTFTNGASDVNQSGLFTTWNVFGANYIVTDTMSGRGIMNLPPLVGGVPTNLNFVFYIVNAGKLFAMETDAVTIATPLLNGVVLQQQSPIGGFSSTSLNGGMVIYLTGRAGSGCGGGTGPASNVLAGLLSADGVGGLNLTYDQNCGGAPTSATGLLGTYSLASNGRTAIRVGTNYVVAYLVSSNQAIFIVPDSSVLFGSGEPQAPVSFTNSTVKGTYAGSTTAPATLGVGIFSGEFTADGASPTGNITGTEDIGSSSGASTGVAANATYSVSSTPTNGRGTIAGSIGGNGIMYTVSPSKFVVVSLNDLNPAVLIFEQ